jgi:molybdopterin/thiamine biosynthesis adenylyltransferase/rhodanese-related sulfurtransferase
MSAKLSAVLDALRGAISEVTPSEAEKARGAGRGAVFIDVRNDDEVIGGVIPGSIHLARGFLEMEAEEAVPAKDADIFVYCAGGTRSLFAAEALLRLGYENVKSISGGYNLWARQGLPTEIPRRLSDAEKRRYRRHVIIPEIGEEGQLRLIDSKVLLIGAGGLGCPAALYLAGAGVGHLGIVDFDRVDESNLQRQVLHSPDRVGELKTVSAKKTLLGFNPLIKVTTFDERLTALNAEAIFKDYDVIVDGSDNFQTRYLVNDVCVKQGKPCVHGSVFRFEGQVSVFDTTVPDAPCYRCVYPEAPPAGFAPSCAEAGVLGVLPGVVGLIEAIEAIKCILGKGDRLVGRLVKYDAWAGSFEEFKLRKNPRCKCCVEHFDFLKDGQAVPEYCTTG